ncbi:DMT family transporter [Streptomyces sp. NRRL WC-3744]|uniref:DMT family transporter n=1 Tax=Streptomyces sp. NRRL WC-3744 TaxID=1463935 RepID=UPI0004CC38A8|nr:DMT family transporter [Streptomyces sp. NRRL WC-3744]
MILSVVLAVLAACSNALGTVLQRRAALTVPASTSLRIGLLADLLRTPVWLAGIAGVTLSAILQALALASGSLAVVQPVFILELPLALVIGGMVFHVRRSRRSWASVAYIAVGLAVFLLSLAPSGGRERVPVVWWLPTLVVIGAIGTALVLSALRRPFGLTRAAALAAGAALGNALAAALMKTAMDVLGDQGLVAFLLSWQTYGFAVIGGTSLFLLGAAMQAGPLIGSQPALTLTDAVTGVVLGVTLYAEQPRTGPWILSALLGFGLLTYGVLRLSRTRCLAECLNADEEAPDQAEKLAV